MKTIKWNLSVSFCNSYTEGEFEVEDNVTDEEIEQLTKEEVFNEIDWSWWKDGNNE